MGMGDFIILLILVGIAGVIGRSLWKNRKKNSCGGDCSHCNKCR